MKRINELLVMMAMLTLGIFSFADKQTALAAEPTSFSVAPVENKDAISQSGYFDLRLKPDTDSAVTIKITNQAKTTGKFVINLNEAYTSSNGVIAYDQKTPKLGATLEQSFGELVAGTSKKTVTIAAGKTRQVSFKLQMPDQAFRGQVMGGLQVVRESDQESGSITDRYSVAVPVVIRQTKNQLKGQVNLVKASYRLENGVGVINLKTQNTAPWVLPSVQVTGNVIRRSDNEVVTTLKKREMALAPNSQFSLPVQVKKALAAGDYTLHYTAQASATNQVWHFNKDFTVKANQVTQNSQTPGTWWRENWLWLTGLVIVAIAAGLKLANMKKRREK